MEVVELSNTLTLKITNAPSHDPILVQLNDFGRGRGRITISESGSSWTSMWGAMGGSLVNFIQRINNHYWIGYLDKNLTAHIDDDDEANYNFAKKQIIKLRKEKEITAEKARDFYHRLEIEGDVKENYSLCVELFGDDPYYVGWPQIENPEYTFMESRLNAVRRALNTMPKFDTLEDCRIDFEMQHAKEAGLYLEHIGYRYESMRTEKAFNAWCKAKGFTFIE